MSPLSRIEQDLTVVPSVNNLCDGRSTVMMENTTNKDIWIKQNAPVCLIAGTNDSDCYDDILNIDSSTQASPGTSDNLWDQAEEALEAEELRGPEQKPELLVFNTMRAPEKAEPPDDTPEQTTAKIRRANSAIISEVNIPDEFNILKRPRTLSDQELLGLFDLKHLDAKDRGDVERLILEFPEIWSEHSFDLGLHNSVEHDIELTDDLPPCPKQRFWPANKREAAEELIDNLEKHKIVSKCIADWATNVVLIKKVADPANRAMEQPLLDDLLEKQSIPTPAKAKYRLCLDLRPTNSVTKADVATLGNMDAMFMHLSGKPARSSFDFTNGFFQIGLTERSKGTTFFVHRRSGSCIMKFNRSIQGSKNASSVFTRAMEVTFAGLQNIVNFWVDDLIAHSNSVQQHLKDLKLVFQRIRGSNLKLSPAKAKFLAGTVKYLGMVIEGDNFSIADRKLKAIDDLIAPKNYVQLRSQFALFQYYKKFIPFFSDVVEPMQKLMKKDAEFIWDSACMGSYVLLKSLFKEKISLHLPDGKNKYVIHTDASSFASSATLHQRINGELMPVAFHSEAFSGPQIGYSILDKELYAMVDAVKKFEYYISGTEFEMVTDSKVLLYLRKAKDSNPKLLRYSLLLQGYDFTITHVSSTQNKIADILSRTRNEEGQELSRTLHMAKKEILARIREDTEKTFIEQGRSLSAEQVVTLLQDPNPRVAVLRETPWSQPAVMAALCLQIPCSQRDKVMIKAEFADSQVRRPSPQCRTVFETSHPVFLNTPATLAASAAQRQLDLTRQQEIVAATSFHSGGMEIGDFIRLQDTDPYCREIAAVMNSAGMSRIYKKVGGVIVKMPPLKAPPQMTRMKSAACAPRIVVPECLVDVLVDRIHSGPLGAHIGHTRVCATLQKKYHFKDMQNRVANRVRRCIPCQLNMYVTNPNHQQHLTTSDDIPRRTVAIDLSTDYPPVKGINHIMVFMDMATNYVTLKPLKGKTAKELAEKFQEYMATYGVPSRVRHDQERGMIGGEFKALCDELGIEQVLGLPNKPQTNGRIESQVRNTKYALKSLTTAQGSKTRWPSDLWKVQLALNTSVSRATGETPEQLLFGHESSRAVHDLLETEFHFMEEEHMGTTRASIAERHEMLLESRNPKQRARLLLRNQMLRRNEYKVGELVWRRIMQPSLTGTRHALDCRYVGPYRIIELHNSSAVIGSNTVRLANQAHVHLDQLKPFMEGRSELGPDWDAYIDHRMGASTRTLRSDLQPQPQSESEHEDDQEPRPGPSSRPQILRNDTQRHTQSVSEQEDELEPVPGPSSQGASDLQADISPPAIPEPMETQSRNVESRGTQASAVQADHAVQHEQSVSSQHSQTRTAKHETTHTQTVPGKGQATQTPLPERIDKKDAGSQKETPSSEKIVQTDPEQKMPSQGKTTQTPTQEEAPTAKLPAPRSQSSPPHSKNSESATQTELQEEALDSARELAPPPARITAVELRRRQAEAAKTRLSLLKNRRQRRSADSSSRSLTELTDEAEADRQPQDNNSQETPLADQHEQSSRHATTDQEDNLEATARALSDDDYDMEDKNSSHSRLPTWRGRHKIKRARSTTSSSSSDHEGTERSRPVLKKRTLYGEEEDPESDLERFDISPEMEESIEQDARQQELIRQGEFPDWREREPLPEAEPQ